MEALSLRPLHAFLVQAGEKKFTHGKKTTIEIRNNECCELLCLTLYVPCIMFQCVVAFIPQFIYCAFSVYDRSSTQEDKYTGYMVNNGWSCSATAPVYLHGIDRNTVTFGKQDSINISNKLNCELRRYHSDMLVYSAACECIRKGTQREIRVVDIWLRISGVIPLYTFMA